MSVLVDALYAMACREMYDDVLYLASILKTKDDVCLGFLQAQDRYRLMHCYALVLLERGYFSKARVILDESLPDLQKLKAIPNLDITESLESMSVADARADDELRIAKCLMKIGSFNEAIVLLERLTPRYRSGRIIVCLAECYYRTNEIGKAIKIYKELLSEFPYALHTLVRLLNLGIPPDEMKQTISDWTSESGHTVRDLLGAWWFDDWFDAQLEIVSKNRLTGLAHLKKAIARLKGNPLILRQLARVSGECGLMLEAVSYYEECFTVDPYNPEDADRYISLLLSLYKTSEAEAMLDHMVTNFRESVQTYTALAYCSRFWSSKKLAFEYAKMAQGLSSTPHVEGYLINGILMAERSSTETAISLLRKTLDMDRTRFEAYEALVNIFLKNGNLNEAENQLHNCMNVLGGTAPVFALCAKVLLNNNNEELGMQTLNHALKLSPNYLPAVYTLAHYYTKNYDYELAEAKLTSAMLEYPSHPELIRIMRSVKWKLGKLSEYRNYSKMIEEIGPFPVSDKLSFVKCDELWGLFTAEDGKGIGEKENFSKNGSFENVACSTRDDQSSEMARFWLEISRLSKIIAASAKFD
ncbi:Anaphase-promoting complex subunit 7 [Trichinella pseudospiralis]|uniref:Anaphase-promoting complex subunit 7 n=1 Tax=Trichinella pseudospiralis TaxID=6337 RepID=A0A0V1G6U3_TRIPS|nr:Anaphase-promoting complex subunit 7 [Trichinella pseudospiralis]